MTMLCIRWHAPMNITTLQTHAYMHSSASLWIRTLNYEAGSFCLQ